MRFWSIGRLKDELRKGPLPQRAAFAYVLATFLLYAVTTAAPGMWNGDADPVSTLDWAAYVAMVLLVGVGTYASFRANGGSAGLDFAARYCALGWVLGIRLAVLAGVLAFLVASSFAVSVTVAVRGTTRTPNAFAKAADVKRARRGD